MNWETLENSVLVKRIQDQATSDVEKNYEEVANVKSNKGEVVAVDPNDSRLSIGDIVLFSEHAANDIKVDGEDYLLLHRMQVYLRRKTVKLNLKARVS